jgi:hypothetical protein
MSHDTSLPAHVRQGLPSPAGESCTQGPTRALRLLLVV